MYKYYTNIIDTQVHFREPGSTDVEDLESGSKAAVLGGVTSLFEMPNTNPPTSNQTEFNKKLSLAKNRMYSNYAFYFGATPHNMEDLKNVDKLEGCCGVKLFAGSSTGNLLVKDEKDIEKVKILLSKKLNFCAMHYSHVLNKAYIIFLAHTLRKYGANLAKKAKISKMHVQTLQKP